MGTSNADVIGAGRVPAVQGLHQLAGMHWAGAGRATLRAGRGDGRAGLGGKGPPAGAAGIKFQ
jgi:hypothetical protein